MNTTDTKNKAAIIEKLAFTAQEVADLLDVSKLTVWRLEKRNLIQPVPGLRARYTGTSVRALCSGETEDAR